MHATQRLAPVDEANLALDRVGQVNVFVVAGVLERGGFVAADGSLDMRALRSAIGDRVDELAVLRRTVVRKRFRLHWAEVSPELSDHVRLHDGVEGLPGLESLCGRLMSVPLPRDRPMWELLIVPGVHVHGVGIVLRIHHAIADGMAAVAIVEQLFDRDGTEARAPGVLRTPPGASESEGLGIIRRLRIGMQRVRMTLWGREVRPTVLLGARSPRRGVVFLGADLVALEGHARAFGATVNDVLLAAVASGYRAVLAAAGEIMPARLPVSVPVALRRHEGPANQVGVMLVRLPLDVPDPDERLRVIAAQTRTEKATARRMGTLELMRGPLGARILNRLASRQHLVAGFVTNVPGTPAGLALAGAPVSAVWPVAVLAANVRLNVAATSYAGRLRCSVHFDAEHVDGVAFADAMREELVRMSVGG